MYSNRACERFTVIALRDRVSQSRTGANNNAFVVLVRQKVAFRMATSVSNRLGRSGATRPAGIVALAIVRTSIRVEAPWPYSDPPKRPITVKPYSA
jgi:hypothetical protein